MDRQTQKGISVPQAPGSPRGTARGCAGDLGIPWNSLEFPGIPWNSPFPAAWSRPTAAAHQGPGTRRRSEPGFLTLLRLIPLVR